MSPIFIKSSTVVVVLSLLFFSCQSDVLKFTIEKYGNEEEYAISIKDSLSFYIGTKNDNQIDYFALHIDSVLSQYIAFYDDGTIKSKEVWDKDKQRQGRVYFFYKGSGCLSGDFMYQDNKLHGYGYQYFCNHNYLKKIFYYQYDELIYSKEFDEDGNIIEIFGDEPQL
jgi:hypothetical protein